jgi:hypothetical protein
MDVTLTARYDSTGAGGEEAIESRIRAWGRITLRE